MPQLLTGAAAHNRMADMGWPYDPDFIYSEREKFTDRRTPQQNKAFALKKRRRKIAQSSRRRNRSK